MGESLLQGIHHLIRLWDFSRRELITEIPHPSAIGTNIVFSPDGRLIASVSGSQQLYIWNIYTEERKIINTGHTNRYVKITFSPDGKSSYFCRSIERMEQYDFGIHQMEN